MVARVGCEDKVVDGLGVGVRTTQEELNWGVEGQVLFLGINYSIRSGSFDTVIGDSG